ncbi:MAG: N-acetyl-gamma-glutamyl-phosphate reductase [Pseudomonadota bacterium]
MSVRTTTARIGVIGARGHTGAELLALIAAHPGLELAYAASREFAGRPVRDVAPAMDSDLTFEAIAADDAPGRGADACVLALPDGAGADYAAAFEAAAPDTVLVDLSSDHRFTDDWVYGLPELHRSKIKGAKRIANPGCYATGMQLSVAPVLSRLSAPAAVFGVSGYSGAGTKPSRRNDVDALADNLMPYALIGHKHEREATRHLGAAVRFTPHVAPFFRGITLTISLEFSEPQTLDGFRAAYVEAYADEPLLCITDDIPEVKDAANAHGVTLGGFALSDDGRHGVLVATEDNLLKGAATQAMQNVNLALGFDELAGVPV